VRSNRDQSRRSWDSKNKKKRRLRKKQGENRKNGK